MDENKWSEIETIIDKALTLSNDDRTTFINQRCRGDAQLKTEIIQLLQSITDSEGWLENPREYKEELLHEESGELGTPSPTDSLIGAEIGSYLITQKLGQGGMGSVYLAERADGEFRHQVAIKIIRNEKATDKNIQRFQQERSILAGLNHQGIAKLFDGGITDTGFPYFIMEYVDGIPIDKYCQENDCTVAQRLELFKQVLEAVQHAHENLIVHRDLKPGNILVNRSGHVKILDFGISKLLQNDGGPSTLTQTDDRLLTPRYAAPEQVLESPVTTATDIYALGIVLYKLLTNEHPLNIDKLSHFEVEQAILEKSIPKPSSKASTSKLQAKLRGDLNAIVLKSIRKEPVERYRTANEFLDDLQRYQEGLPVTARRDSTKYRVQKFASRHRQGLVATSIILLLTIGFTGFYTWRITQERNRAQLQQEHAEEMTDFLLSLFEANNPRENSGKDFPVSEIINRGLHRLEAKKLSTQSRTLLLGAIGQIQLNIGETEQAGKTIEHAYALASDSITEKSASVTDIYTVFGSWHQVAGSQDSALALFRKADSLHRAKGTIGEEYRINLVNMADIYNQTGQYKQAVSTLNRFTPPQTTDRKQLLVQSYYFNNLAVAYAGLGNHRKSLKLYEKSLKLKEQIYDGDNSELAQSYHNIAVLYLRRDLSHRAYELFKKAYQIRKKTFGPDHQLLGSTLSGLASAANNIGKPEESIKYHRESIRIVGQQNGTDHYRYAFALRNYARYLIDTKNYRQAADTLTRAHNIITQQYGSDHVLKAYITQIMADLYGHRGKFKQADSYFKQTKHIFEDNYGADYSRLARVYSNHAEFKFTQQHFEHATKLLLESDRILKVNKDTTSILYGRNQYYLGKTQRALNHKLNARPYFEKAYRIIRHAKSDTAELVLELAKLLSDNKDQ